MDSTSELTEEIRATLNRASRENVSNTPDHVLAVFLMECLEAFERGAKERDRFYGQNPKPAAATYAGRD